MAGLLAGATSDATRRREGPCEGDAVDRPFCSASQIASVAQGFRDRAIPADGIFLDVRIASEIDRRGAARVTVRAGL